MHDILHDCSCTTQIVHSDEELFYFCMTLAISNIAFSIWWANRFEDVVGHVVFDDTYKIFENFFCKKNLWFQGISR